MYDCSNDVVAHHDQDVTLPQAQRSEMKTRRDSNRTRLRNGLSKAGGPAPLYFRSQGSYAMRTMVQHPANDYDIDDGVYFEKAVLIGERGAEMSALQARNKVRDAVDDGKFATPPEVRKNCVRVYYQAGYHVDLPVYRRVATRDAWGGETYHFELASSSWKRSDACDVTQWFERENNQQSPDTVNGRQLRRITRQLKAFARSRDSWSGRMLSGFGITVLVTECFHAEAAREDRALYETMKAIRNRLNLSCQIDHPCTQGARLAEQDDARARFFRDKLSEALEWLKPLFEIGCTREAALKAWDKVFATTFFSERPAPAARSPGLLTAGLLQERAALAQAAVRREGGGRYA